MSEAIDNRQRCKTQMMKESLRNALKTISECCSNPNCPVCVDAKKDSASKLAEAMGFLHHQKTDSQPVSKGDK